MYLLALCLKPHCSWLNRRCHVHPPDLLFLGLICQCWAASSHHDWGQICRCWAGLASIGHHWAGFAHICWVEFTCISHHWGGLSLAGSKRERWEKTGHDKCCGPFFIMHYVGLPLQGSPLVFLPPWLLHQISPSHPHPFEKGRGSCSCILACEVGGVLMAEPTSLNRGEGLAAGWLVEVEGPICGGEGRDGGGKMSENQP